MKFHYGAVSPNSRRALAAAFQLGYDDLELIPIQSFADFESPLLLSRNPNGMVPVLVDGDFNLWESNAIMQYLADRKGGTDLFPGDPRTRADIARWQFWTVVHFDEPAGKLLWENGLKQVLAGPGEPDPKEVEAGLAGFREIAGIVDEHLKARDWLVGRNLTLADLSLAGTLMYAKVSKFPMSEFPNFSRWFARVAETDGWIRSGKLIPGIEKP